MIQQFHFWVYRQKHWKQNLKETSVYPWSKKLYSQRLKRGSKPSVLWSMHTVGQDSALKRKFRHNTGEPWGHYIRWNKRDTEGQILYDSTYVIPNAEGSTFFSAVPCENSTPWPGIQFSPSTVEAQSPETTREVPEGSIFTNMILLILLLQDVQ